MDRRLLLAALVLLALFPARSAASGVPPSLRVEARGAVVRGAHFGASGRVTVTLFTGTGTRIVRTTTTGGAFRVAFAVPANGCSAAYAVRARGADGAAATLVFAQPPTCVPPPLR